MKFAFALKVEGIPPGYAPLRRTPYNSLPLSLVVLPLVGFLNSVKFTLTYTGTVMLQCCKSSKSLILQKERWLRG